MSFCESSGLAVFITVCVLGMAGWGGVGVSQLEREDKPNHTRLYSSRSQLHWVFEQVTSRLSITARHVAMRSSGGSGFPGGGGGDVNLLFGQISPETA